MSQIYTYEITDTPGQMRSASQDRLPRRAAVLTIFALSVLAWSPILLPLAALLHR